MVRGAARRRKPQDGFDILLVPHAEGGKTRKFRSGLRQVALMIILFFLASVGITLALLIYTPLAMYVPIPNPELEKRYGEQIAQTREQLRYLTEDVMLLKDYNSQLRKALGEGATGDSTTSTGLSSTLLADGRGAASHVVERSEMEEAARPLQADLQHEELPGELGEETDISPKVFASAYPGEAVDIFPLFMPTDGYMTQGFDPSRGHYGVDIAGKQGTPVSAAGDGRVVFAGWTFDDGNMIIISHGGRTMTVYKHNQVLLKTARLAVKRGEPIALLGTSGRTSKGPHLHFEVWKDGVPQDPREFLLTLSTIQ